jgi:hypothetical protein
MPLTAKKHTERNRHRDKKKVFSEVSGGCMNPVRNNSLNDSKFFRAYLVTI